MSWGWSCILASLSCSHILWHKYASDSGNVLEQGCPEGRSESTLHLRLLLVDLKMFLTQKPSLSCRWEEDRLHCLVIFLLLNWIGEKLKH